jgi:pimeloyl-ACP methyl ester carboxylesterase
MTYQTARITFIAGVSVAFALIPFRPLPAQRVPSTPGVRNIVLVHGAFADGTSWSKVIPVLEARGYHVVAVQNPLTSLTDDVAATTRLIALQDGPVLLVGHSWGGAVITQAGDDPKVAGLVYVTAYAPDAGQSANDASAPFGVTEGQKQIRVDGNRFASMTLQGVVDDIAEGLPMADRQMFFAVQGQSFGPMFDEKLTVAAWKTRPVSVVVSSNDRMLPPAMELLLAKKLGLTATILSTCHLSILEQPEKVADVIDHAAKSALKR